MNLKQAVNRYKTSSLIYLKNAGPTPRTGELKRSMKLINRPNGWEINYSTTYRIYRRKMETSKMAMGKP